MHNDKLIVSVYRVVECRVWNAANPRPLPWSTKAWSTKFPNLFFGNYPSM